MSGYVGYLGRYRHSSDGRHAADIRRASAEHQGLEYVEEPEQKKTNKSHTYYGNKPQTDECSVPQFNVKKAKRHKKAELEYDSDHQRNSHDDVNIMAQMATATKPKKEAADCKIVYKKSRKLSMSNFQS